MALRMPKIPAREDVRTAEGEHEKHLDRPNTDTFHLCKGADNLFVCHASKVFEDNLLRCGFLRQITDVGCFLPGQTEVPQFFEAKTQDRVRM